MEQPGAEDEGKEEDLADEVPGEYAFEVEMGLLDGFHVGKEDHADEAGDEPFEGDGEIGAGMEPGAEYAREKSDQKNEYDADGGVN